MKKTFPQTSINGESNIWILKPAQSSRGRGIVLMKNLPKSICEIGLVNCGISDIGGIEILQCMLNSPNLQMICMEQNNFSEKLKLEFNKFRTANPHILVVY